MNAVSNYVTQPRGVGVPITIVKDFNTPLSQRRTADRSEVKRFMRTLEDDCEYVQRPKFVRAHVRDALQDRRGLISMRTQDDGGMLTFDAQTIDSSGAFLIGELENLDPRLHMPLASVSWMEDIKIRSNVTIADDLSSYTLNSFAAGPGVPGSNKNWVGKRANSIPSLAVDNEKIAQRIEPWALSLDWTMFELEQSRKLGRPIDEQKHVALQRKWNYDLDEETYMGDTAFAMNGMFQHALLTNVSNAVTGSWTTATPAQIIVDLNEPINSIAGTSGLAVLPDTAILAWSDLSLLTTTLISTAGNISILEYFLRNNPCRAAGVPFRVKGRKWLVGTSKSFGGVAGRGPSATNSMYYYRNEEDYLRIPVVPLLRTNPEFRDIRQIVTYYGRIGQVEMVYPELVALRTNIN